MSEKTILVVDDEPIVRESIRDWLKEAGYNVMTAETGEEAIKLLEKYDISILVIDVRLPGRTGISVLKDVKASKPQIKSIVITAYPSEELSEEAKKQGAVDYLVKPINPDDLEVLIRDTLSQM
jgi:DNA-binding NtrC family response regulator